MSFLRDIKDLPDPDDQDTKEIVILSRYDDDTRPVITMIHPNGHVVGQVRRGSIIHRVMIANGYKVMKS